MGGTEKSVVAYIPGGEVTEKRDRDTEMQRQRQRWGKRREGQRENGEQEEEGRPGWGRWGFLQIASLTPAPLALTPWSCEVCGAVPRA